MQPGARADAPRETDRGSHRSSRSREVPSMHADSGSRDRGECGRTDRLVVEEKRRTEKKHLPETRKAARANKVMLLRRWIMVLARSDPSLGSTLTTDTYLSTSGQTASPFTCSVHLPSRYPTRNDCSPVRFRSRGRATSVSRAELNRAVSCGEIAL